MNTTKEKTPAAEKQGGKRTLQSLRALAGTYASVFALIAIVVVFLIINPSFLNRFNTKNLLTNMAPLLVMACGATYVRLLGSLDLSMGAVCSCANVMLIRLFPSLGAGAYVVAILFGMLTGVILGLIHTKLKIPSFIASLGMMNVYNSVALLITPMPMTIPAEYRSLINWGKTSFGVINMMTIVSVLIMVIAYFVQKKSVLGKSLSLIGANERAARISGIRVDRTKIFAFTVCGAGSALAGVLLAIKLQSSAPTVGSPFTLLAVAAVLLGGTSMTGGKGSVLMTLTGVMMVTVIENGMTIIGVDAFWSQIVFGGLIIVAMALTSDRSTKNLMVK
ncbi:ABC transporter permease [Feifania hominis]|uniref:ABC transporter permease n=1 Tax=Feifania hominis TaxID=2763660 RepID=A0A926HPK9_9FIRM|nr:ABC transporter permease [Feifania hominis]MBC8535382.1 ABC transporter permease [Feifania hominis]